MPSAPYDDDMEARVISCNPKMIRLEIDGQLRFQTNYQVLRHGIRPIIGDKVEFNFRSSDRSCEVLILSVSRFQSAVDQKMVK
jgi:hypothetical protein